MATPYVPRLVLHDKKDGDTSLFMYKVVRISPSAAFPTLPVTTVSFDWKRYQKLLAKHSIDGKRFGQLVRAAYAELLAAGGFVDTKPASQQLWWHVVRALESQSP